MDAVETRTIRKISKRLIPFLIVCYLFAYLDRVNIGFAALTMNKALGLSATMFGFGAGIFFVTYFAFELPSNLFLDRLGARWWIGRIMVSWGMLAGLMAFIPQISDATGIGTEKTFYTIRALLGLAEAGFFPGIIYYLTLWYPPAYRARITGAFMVALPLSSAIGGPIIRDDFGPRRFRRLRRLAVAFCYSGGASGLARLCDIFLSYRSTERCTMARGG